jgi:hypothetical protein
VQPLSETAAIRESAVPIETNGVDPEAVLRAWAEWPVLLPNAEALRTGRFPAVDLKTPAVCWRSFSNCWPGVVRCMVAKTVSLSSTRAWRPGAGRRLMRCGGTRGHITGRVRRTDC